METGYSRASKLWGWAMAPVFIVHSIIQINMPRTDKTLPLREELRGWHYIVGTLLLILVIGRLWAWWKERTPEPPAGMGAGAWHWGRMLALTSYLTLLVAPVLGLLYGWSSGYDLYLGPIDLPALVGKDRNLWLFSGYFHSGLGFMMLVLNVAAILTIAYTLFRYGRGAFAALPPGYGLMVLGGLSVTSYAFATFRSPEPGPRAVAIFWGVLAVTWLLAKLLGRTKVPATRPAAAKPVPGWARVVAPTAAVAVLALGAYGPYAMFRVTPWPMGEVIEADPSIQSHMTLVTKVEIAPSTPFEEQVRAETYKWCGFCHLLTKAERGQQPKVGPNLWGIFGQKAASVPNFHYSEALANARDRGLVWTDENMAAYVANPHEFVPGTTMIISSGPITDPKAQMAIVNLLKRDTMTE
jgi:cytochrome c2/cytochrome b561